VSKFIEQKKLLLYSGTFKLDNDIWSYKVMKDSKKGMQEIFELNVMNDE